MRTLTDYTWFYFAFLASLPIVRMLSLDGVVINSIILSLFLSTAIFTFIKRRKAIYNNGELHLKSHGYVKNIVALKRIGSNLIAVDNNNVEYAEICSYCFTRQIDNFVADVSGMIDVKS